MQYVQNVQNLVLKYYSSTYIYIDVQNLVLKCTTCAYVQYVLDFYLEMCFLDLPYIFKLFKQKNI